ncbi:hypothetical protein BKA69DRAFT_1100616 [Paraphysoderma sedebokerense]|nr:hypothetical protein BKA69DRAFT_1100616 [Paraphysoderma sedebokerense]
MVISITAILALHITLFALLTIDRAESLPAGRLSTRKFLALSQKQQEAFWSAWGEQLNNYATNGQAVVGLGDKMMKKSKSNLYLSLTGGVSERRNFASSDLAERNQAVWSVADQVPTPITQGRMGSFFRSYKDFVTSLSVPEVKDDNKETLKLKEQLKELETEQSKLLPEYRSSREEASKRYQKFKENTPEEKLSFEEYLNKYENVDSLKLKLDSIKNLIRGIRVKLHGPEFEKINEALDKLKAAGQDRSKSAYNMLCNQIVDPTADVNGKDQAKAQNSKTEQSGQVEKRYCPSYLMDAGKTFQEWRALGPDAPRGFVMKVNTTQKTNKKFNFGLGVEATGPSVVAPFLDLSAGIDLGVASNTAIQTKFSAEISFTQVATIPVKPDAWFDPTLITNYNQRTKYGIKSKDQTDFSKQLSKIVQKVVIGYRPRVQISFDREFFNNIKFNLGVSAGAKIKMGPLDFPVKLKSGIGSDNTKDDAQSMPGLTFEDNSKDAFVVLGYVTSDTGL